MKNQLDKIMKFSNVVYVLLSITFVMLIVVGALQMFTFFWNLLDLKTEVLTIAGIEAEYPLLFKIGSVKVYLPMAWESSFDFLGVRSVLMTNFSDVLLTIFTIVGLGFAKVVFSLLRKTGSPFREDVIKALKRLSIALLLMGVVSGLVPFVAAGVVWVLCMIFDYGLTLQAESDTTL